MILEQIDEPILVSDIIGTDYGEEWKKRYLLLWMSKHGLLQIVGD